MDKLIKNLDLTVVKNKLKHHSGESWDNERVQLAEQEYKRFLHLCKKFPSLTIGLTKEADIFWHYHILNTQKYAKDCETIFGHFLHHDPDMLEPEMPIHNTAIDNYINLYIKEFKLNKKEKMAHSARVVDSIVPMAHSARVSGKNEEMAHSARVSMKNEEMAHSARVSMKNEEMAHSARVSMKNEEMAHSARVSMKNEEMAHSARVSMKNEEMAHSARVSMKNEEMAHSARVSMKNEEMAHSARVSMKNEEMAHSARVSMKNEELAVH